MHLRLYYVKLYIEGILMKKRNILTIIILVLAIVDALFITQSIYKSSIQNSVENTQYKVKNMTVTNRKPNENYVDLLKNINHDTVGYLKVNGTNIDYPVVQSNDNDYYLHHTFDGKTSDSGAVFLDYRNDLRKLDKNNIIYAHAMLNGTQFGTLRRIVSPEWLSNKDNLTITLMNEDRTMKFEVISVYSIPVTNDYLYTKFNSDEAFLEFEEKMINRSIHDFGVTPNKDDKLLTLSTCKANNERYVLHARLIN